MKTTAITIGRSTYNCELLGPNTIGVRRDKGRALKDTWPLASAFEKAHRAPLIAASTCPLGCAKDGADLVSVGLLRGDTSILCRTCGTRRNVPDAAICITKVEVLS